MRNLLTAALLMVVVATIASPSQAAIGTEFTYQGRLANGGSPANGLHDLRFRLYDASTLGATVGALVCIDNVSVADGLFTVSLDFGAQFVGEERFLEIEVRADTGLTCVNPAGFVILSPRQALTAAPNALFASAATSALQLNGQPSTFYRNASNINSGTLPDARLSTNIPRLNSVNAFGNFTNTFLGNVGVGTATPAGKLHVQEGSAGAIAPHSNSSTVLERSGNNYLQMYAPDANESGLLFGNASQDIRAAILADANDAVLFRTGGNTTRMTLDAAGNLGIGTAPIYPLDVRTASPTAIAGESTATTGTSYGGRFESASTLGRGVIGLANAATGITYGGYFESDSSAGRGVFGKSAVGGRFESDTTTGQGVFGGANSATGITYGGRFENDSTSGRGVYGIAFAATGTTYGVKGDCNSPDGYGVYGVNTATTLNAVGVYGRTSSTGGSGVYGESNAATGNSHGVEGLTTSSSGAGVLGRASSTSTNGTSYGVWGFVSSDTGYGVYSVGDLGASGSKSFRIDHPFDPLNKYLLHYCSESPMPQNFYVGNVITDATGYAWVELPDYFEEINANFKYTVTVVDDADSDGFVMAKVSKKIRGNRFQIRTSAPQVEVSWRVDADRNDLWVRNKQPRDVIDKLGPEKGKYQRPELYGAPPEMGMNYDASRERSSPPAVTDEATGSAAVASPR